MGRRRGMAMSFPAFGSVLYRLGARRHLEIEHRILPVDFDIGIECTDKGGVFLGSVLDRSDPQGQHQISEPVVGRQVHAAYHSPARIIIGQIDRQVILLDKLHLGNTFPG